MLSAARALFAERGDDVQLPEVARAAGVGVGTVYRHFPTREALVLAAAQDRFAEIVSFARTTCLGSAEPAMALECYLRHVGEVLAQDRGLSTVLDNGAPSGPVRAALVEVVEEVLAEAKAAGGVSPEASVEDVMMACCGLAAVVRTGSGPWSRYVDLVLGGLRAR